MSDIQSRPTGFYHAGYYLIYDNNKIFIRITFENIWKYK